MGKLVEASIARLTVKPGERDAYAWDQSLAGFGIRAYASGKKTFVVKFALPDGRQRKISLGAALPGTLGDTRKLAHEILSRARLGQDIMAERDVAREKAKKDVTIGELVERYLKLRAADLARGDLSPRSFEGIEYHLRRLFTPLHQYEPENVRQRDISDLIDDLASSKGNRTADNCKTSISTFFAWLVEKEYAGANPCANIRRRNKNKPRHRYLTNDELGKLWRATVVETDFNLIVRLLSLTAARRDEIASLRWSEVDLDAREIRLPKERHKMGRKTGKGRLIFLSDPAVCLIGNISRRPKRDLIFGSGDGPFSGWSRCKEALDKRLGDGVAPWVLHDLRRTFETNASMLKLADDRIIHAATGHWSAVKTGIQAVYNVNEYEPERRELMDDWAAFVLSCVES